MFSMTRHLIHITLWTRQINVHSHCLDAETEAQTSNLENAKPGESGYQLRQPGFTAGPQHTAQVFGYGICQSPVSGAQAIPQHVLKSIYPVTVDPGLTPLNELTTGQT